MYSNITAVVLDVFYCEHVKVAVEATLVLRFSSRSSFTFTFTVCVSEHSIYNPYLLHIKVRQADNFTFPLLVLQLRHLNHSGKNES